MSLNQNTELSLTNTIINAGTITLPLISLLPGRVLTFKDVQGTFGRNSLTLLCSGSDTFEDGGSSKTLRETYGSIQLVGSGTKWYILNGTQVNTVQLSTLISNTISSLNISTIGTYVSSLSFIDNIRSTNIMKVSSAFLSTQNVSTNFLYYNNFVIAGTRIGYSNILSSNISSFIFNPNTISNLSFWFDPSVSTSMNISTNSTLMIWNSVSTTSTYPFSIATSFTVSSPIGVISNAATYVPNSLNGYGGVSCGTTILQTNNLSNIAQTYYLNNITNSEFTTICLVNRFNTGSVNNAAIHTAQFGGNSRVSAYAQSYTYIQQDGIATHTQSLGGYDILSNTPTIFLGTRQGSALTVRLNGSNTISSNYDTFPISNNNFQFYLGTDGLNNFLNFNLYELLHYRQALTLSDITRLEGYVAWKYSIQSNLNSNHPYRFTPPY